MIAWLRQRTGARPWLLQPSRRARLLLAGASVVLYLVCFYPLKILFGPEISVFSALPVVVVAALFGIGGGVLTTMLVCAVSILSELDATLTFEQMAYRFISGPSALLVLGVITGWLTTRWAYTASHSLRLEQDSTELERVASELRHSEAQLRLLFNSSADGLQIIDPYDRKVPWKIVDCNDAFCLMNGYEREELIGQSNSVLNAGLGDWPPPEVFLENVRRDGVIHGQDHHQRKDGTLLLVEYSVSLVTIGGREVLLGIDRDVTERRRVEDAIRTNEERLRAQYRGIPIPTYTWRWDGDDFVLVDCNDAASRFSGDSFYTILGQRREAFFLEYPTVHQAMAKCFREHSTEYLEVRYPILATGQIRDLALTLVFVPPELIMVHLDDMTERRRAEAIIEQERHQLRQVIDVAPVAMAMFDRHMRYVAYSQRWLLDHNLVGHDLVGSHHYDVFPDTPSRLREVNARALAGETLTSPEEKIVNSDGSIAYQRWAVTPWYEAPGQIGGMILAIDSIDELVAAREAALENSRLKSEFLATMSHEIRTPMSSVIGMSELLLATPLTEDQRDCAKILCGSAQSLLTLLNDILDFSRVEAGKLPLDIRDMNLTSVIERASEIVMARAHEKGLDLASYIDPAIPTNLQGDADRLRQVLLNLLGNAVKFTERGHVVVSAELQEVDGDTVTVRVAVSDTGIGLSEMARRRLFEPFTQADGSTTRKYGGTGLGLAISQQLVELMGGTISVESVVGQGSTFWFVMTFACASPYLFPIPPEAEHARVLVVDRNATTRGVVLRYLRAWRMLCDEAVSVDAALTLLRDAAEPYQRVLVDSRIGGRERLVEQVAADPRLTSTRLVLIRRFGDSDHDREGYVQVLTKPLKCHALLAAIVGPETLLPASLDTGDVMAQPVLRFNEGEPPPTAPHILVAEDNAINQRLVRRQLRLLGYQVDLVSNGREALEAFGKHPYALVLMDCQMPEMDGFEATAAIRQAEQGQRRVPIVALTANAMRSAYDAGLAAGMDDYLTKPILIDQLNTVLRHWITPRDKGSQRTDHTEYSPAHITDTHRKDPAAERATVERHDWEPTTEPAIVPAALAELRQIQDDPVEESAPLLIAAYLADAQALIRTMHTALGSGDMAALRQAAHTCGGGSATMGAYRLSRLCRLLDHPDIEPSDSADSLLSALDAEYLRVERVLSAL